MLLKSYGQAYHTLLKALLTLQQYFQGSDPKVTVVEQTFSEAQTLFTQEILPLTPQESDISQAAHWQSIQTEIHRSLRLLGTDILFWRSSKQKATASTRLALIRERISRLIEYCQFMETEILRQENHPN